MGPSRPAPGRNPRTGLTVALSVILVPAAALVAVALAGPNEEPVAAADPAPPAATVAEPSVAVTTPSIVIEPVTATDADLIAACTVDGLTLVAAEASGAITPLQSAALDALRALCAAAGMELPGPPAPPPVVRTVTVDGGARTAPTPTTPPPTPAPLTGQQLYAGHCAGCHGFKGEGTSRGPDIAGDGYSEMLFYATNGDLPEMPAFAGILAADELEALARYAATLGGSGGGSGDDGGDDDDDAGDVQTTGSREAWRAARNAARAAIAAAAAGGGDAEDIQDARESLAEAGRAAGAGDYAEAEAKAREAEQDAKKALQGDD